MSDSTKIKAMKKQIDTLYDTIIELKKNIDSLNNVVDKVNEVFEIKEEPKKSKSRGRPKKEVCIVDDSGKELTIEV